MLHCVVVVGLSLGDQALQVAGGEGASPHLPAPGKEPKGVRSVYHQHSQVWSPGWAQTLMAAAAAQRQVLMQAVLDL